MSVNGPISPKQCYYEMDYSFYSFYWLDSLEIRLDHNSTYYRSLSKNSDVKPRISHCDSQNLQYKTHPEFWPSHRRIFKTSLYYKTRLILETRRYAKYCFTQIWATLWKGRLHPHESHHFRPPTTEDCPRGENIAIEKNIRKVAWNSKILKNKSKDGDGRQAGTVVMYLQWQHYVKPYRMQSWK